MAIELTDRTQAHESATESAPDRADLQPLPHGAPPAIAADELAEWLEALDQVVAAHGRDAARGLLETLIRQAHLRPREQPTL
ncbi:MAG: hypothetical protein PVF43_09440, partial [Candidatus Eiseniibacteriota bacterium]